MSPLLSDDFRAGKSVKERLGKALDATFGANLRRLVAVSQEFDPPSNVNLKGQGIHFLIGAVIMGACHAITIQ
jgi:hypothetical protein